MHVAGIDAHATYLVVVIVSNTGELVEGPTRITNAESERLVELLALYEPIEAVVETSPAWPWLYELLSEHGIGFVLAHAKKLRAIAEANYKSDEIDAEVLARMRVAGLIPEVHPSQRIGASRRCSFGTARAWFGSVRPRRAGSTRPCTRCGFGFLGAGC